MARPFIYLASRSPRRRELLHQIHVAFDVLPFRGGLRAEDDVSEDKLAGEDPDHYVERVARAKARGGVARVRWRKLQPQLVLAADTVVDLDGEILGKPENPEHALEMLRQLCGHTHRVLTAVAVAQDDEMDVAVSVSEVRMARLDDEGIRRYVASGEPLDKAGAYAIQGRAAMFVEEIRGSHSGIMGLPLFETARLLRRFGYPL
ncbi:MAG: septum formation inhibitor Maf [Betaproteobacteria bacterium]|nr:septum formation inhibitor Maf [Betaproteobacteria bacterium]